MKPDGRSFDDRMHAAGRIWTSVCLAVLLPVPVFLCVYLDTVPPPGGLLRALAGVLVIYVPVCIVEVLAYSPALGTGASYLAFVTGNLSNLKLPCALNAQKLVGTEQGTPENEVVLTLSVAVSAIVTCLVLAAGVLLLVPLTPLLAKPELQPAFANILPALFGALGFTYLTKQPKIAALPLVVMVALCLAVPAAGGQVGILIPAAAVISMAWARFLYRKQLI